MIVSCSPTRLAAAITSFEERILQAGDVLPNRAAEEFDVLRKIAKIAVTAGGEPNRHVGAVEPHMPDRGSDGAGDEASESRLAGPGGSDHAEDLARARP